MQADTDIPLFGGPAHGEWVDAVRKTPFEFEHKGAVYAVHWVVPASEDTTATRDSALWFGVTDGYEPQLHCREVIEAYAAKDRVN